MAHQPMSDDPRGGRAEERRAGSEVTPLWEHDVRIRCVIADEHQTQAYASVFCPRRERSVSLEVCSACEAAAGLRTTANGVPVARCSERPEHEPRPASAALQRDPSLIAKLSRPVADIMTKTAICVRKEMSLKGIHAVLQHHGFGGLPVVDEEGRPIGLVTKTDLLRTYGKRQDLGADALVGMTVESIMTALALAVHERSSIAQAAALMAYEGVHRLPVIDDANRVVGVVSSLDVLHWLGERTGYLMRPLAPHQP